MSNPGQWAGGFQAWDGHGVYMATARGVLPGRMLKVPAESLGEVAREWFPFGVHLIAGLVNTVRSIEAKARQRESLVALGTLAAGLAHEINNPASAATRAVDALDRATEALGSVAARGWPRARRPLSSSSSSTPCAATVAEGGDQLDPVAAADREEELADWLVAPRRGPRLGHRPAVRGGRGRRGRVRTGGRRSPARTAGARPGVDGQLADRRRPAGRDPRGDPPGLRAGQRGALLLPAGPRPGAADRCHRRAGEHPGHARPQAARRDHRRPRLRARPAGGRGHPG